ncbi:MAG TPA: tripartite tricarboxylate transporter substrate-binding protein [candidate division Zixibacteria bacterium]|nr:tripartite tricarboxylate transporter substrate-binding protein [candidate division Zixibacteria bacterium]
MSNSSAVLRTLVLLTFLAGALPPAALRAQGEPFYKGKSIRVVVGFTPGGFYDRWARLVARHIGKHIPGNPEIIVQNMPGAGSVIATNYVYAVAKPDGLTLGMPSANIYMDQLTGRGEVKFDVRRFNWIGTQDKRHLVFYIRSDTQYKSVGDLMKAKEPPKCGETGTTSSGYLLTKIIDEVLGAKLSTVLGYPGGAEVDLAVEKGEVVCRGMSIDPYFGREPFISWGKKGFVRLLVQTGSKRDPRAPDVPTIYELMDQYKVPDINRRVVRLILAGAEFGSPFFAAPGTPADRVKILREAHAKTMKDPDLIGEAKKSKMDMDPSTGEELQELTREVMAQPREVIERARKITGM